MKLVISIVQDDDSVNLLKHLTEGGYRVTKLATTGGFLKSGNTTLLIGVDDDKVDEVIKIIETNCKLREQVISPPNFINAASVYSSYPIEVEVGGATVFVVDVDKFIRI